MPMVNAGFNFRRLPFILFLTGRCLCWAGPELTAPTEYEVKAAFLYNFAKFVEWPAQALPHENENFVIGLLGEDPFGPSIDRMLEGKTVQNRRLILKRLHDIQEASACQVLFISSSEGGRLKQILLLLDESPVLTVSDMDIFIQRGGMIGLAVEDKKVRFSLNKATAEAARLKFSSQVLKLATRVVK